MTTLDVSVVIPTIGRPERLDACLRSLEACAPRPAEVVVVDQSRGDDTLAAVEAHAGWGVRHVRSSGIGRPLASNEGLREATHAIVLLTDDDCTVAPDWVAVAHAHLEAHPGAIVTGRVLPAGDDPDAVPSTKTDERFEDYTGRPAPGWLFKGNMGCYRDVVLALGGFDTRIVPAAEDNEFCFRWLLAGGTLHYLPELTVWHHDWRTGEELRRLYTRYAEGDGVFYGKLLREGDMRGLWFATRLLAVGARASLGAQVRGRDTARDWRMGVWRGLPRGMWEGWRSFGPRQPRR